MLTPRENSMAILNGKQPDYYNDFMNSMTFIPDPVMAADAVPQDGEIYKDTWGVEFTFHPGSPGKHPVGRKEGLVIKDIEDWENELAVPDLDDLDWSAAKKANDGIDRDQKFAGVFSSAGLFERSHHLMSFEEALVNYMTYEEEVAELLKVIRDYKIKFIEIAAHEVKPDVIFFQDDWGSKTNVFLPPELWRRVIKPLHTEIVEAAHDCGMIFCHHCDCYSEPLAPDMVEMGIDIWQGVIPQNDIVAIQKATQGKLAMIGGVDGPKIDLEGIAADEIISEVHRAVDTYCPGGKFFPGIANGQLYNKRCMDIYVEEMENYGRQWAQEHPIS